MRWNIIIIMSCDSLIVILVTYFFSSLNLENGLKKHVQNVARIKRGFVELVLILFTLNTGCDYVIPYDFTYFTFSKILENS